MRHLMLFEAFIKQMGEEMTPEEFKKLKKGQEVKYRGTAYIIEKPGPTSIELKSKDKGNVINVNLGMFIQFGAITTPDK